MKKTTTLSNLLTAVFFAALVFIICPVTANAASEAIIGCSIRTTEQVVGYADSSSNLELVSIPIDTKLTVVGEDGNRFLVSYFDQYMWVENTQVLVNVAQLIPSLDVRLAMAKEINFFQMADQSIDGVTNKQFYTTDGSVDGTEAWLKYETAKKLAIAQESFLKDGYSIVIYDAYRPLSVTKDFQKSYCEFLNTKPNSFKTEWFGKLGESWFLAQKASSHNYGVALDMSIKEVETNQVLEMPSKIHTLDKRSAYYIWKDSNNVEANSARYMKTIMENSGFSYLKSEWWHFQDNSVKRVPGTAIDIPN